ncbi:class I SAM-dependent methyltransferase [Streptomyces sp. AJS327]|uniref:class I SAM-dependent methyltransferase n=1 Tax=Streptomyces sp. AJS327 TaxID=2545265 RepID=UPI0015DFA16D|nr:class I SAM-dependent methyltransferase [Streptomyces sp. AJS327]MBA0050992.1 class I SAM-dependent methyltransferase [Streptomyces sp. AJS327]
MIEKESPAPSTTVPTAPRQGLALGVAHRLTGEQAGGDPNDPFGSAYSAVHESGAQRGETHLVYEFEDGYVYAEDAADYFTEPDRWLPVDRWACQDVRGRILDIGCGAGRHATHLVRLGHDVVGVDPSVGGVAVARARGIDARVGSVPELPADLGTFDTFLMLGANLGLLGEPGRSSRILDRLAELARPGAQLIGTNIDFEAMPRPGGGEAVPEPADEPPSVQRFARMRVRHRTAATDWFDFLFCPPNRLQQVTADSRWRVTSFRRDTATELPTYMVRLLLQ